MGMLLRRHSERAEGTSEVVVNPQSLADMTSKDLKKLAKDKGVAGYSTMSKEELLEVLNGSI